MQRSRTLTIIGLTGSIGMGKSFVASEVRKRSIPLFDADEEVANILCDKKIIAQIFEHFPGVVVNGVVDRARLGDQAFRNKQKLSLLERIVYPSLDQELEVFLKQDSELVVLDIPLLYEKSYDKLCDYVILVSASREAQLERLMARPNMDVEKVESILSHQLHDSEKRKRADFIIDTNISHFHTILQLEGILRRIG